MMKVIVLNGFNVVHRICNEEDAVNYDSRLYRVITEDQRRAEHRLLPLCTLQAIEDNKVVFKTFTGISDLQGFGITSSGHVKARENLCQ